LHPTPCSAGDDVENLSTAAELALDLGGEVRWTSIESSLLATAA
jgi:hypothetical protein